MNTSHLSPERLQRLKTLCTLVAGACLPLLGDALVRASLLVLVPLQSYTWRDYAGAGIQIVALLFTLTISYRVVRRSTLPSVLAIGVLLGLVWMNSLLN